MIQQYSRPNAGEIDIFLGNYQSVFAFSIAPMDVTLILWDLISGKQSVRVNDVVFCHYVYNGRTYNPAGSNIATAALAGFFGFGLIVDVNSTRKIQTIDYLQVQFGMKDGSSIIWTIIPGQYQFYADQEGSQEIEEVLSAVNELLNAAHIAWR
jgi:hypothetical protein